MYTGQSYAYVGMGVPRGKRIYHCRIFIFFKQRHYYNYDLILYTLKKHSLMCTIIIRYKQFRPLKPTPIYDLAVSSECIKINNNF